MPDETYTLTIVRRGARLSYSLNWWRSSARAPRGWKPDRKVTGTVDGPIAGQMLHLLREMLED